MIRNTDRGSDNWMVRFNGEDSQKTETLVDIKGKGPYLGPTEISPFAGTNSTEEIDTKHTSINVAGWSFIVSNILK